MHRSILVTSLSQLNDNEKAGDYGMLFNSKVGDVTLVKCYVGTLQTVHCRVYTTLYTLRIYIPGFVLLYIMLQTSKTFIESFFTNISGMFFYGFLSLTRLLCSVPPACSSFPFLVPPLSSCRCFLLLLLDLPLSSRFCPGSLYLSLYYTLPSNVIFPPAIWDIYIEVFLLHWWRQVS